MRSSGLLAPLFFAASTLAQAVPEGIAPSAPPPAGCERNADGKFTIGTLKLGHASKRESAVEAADSALVCTLKDGVLRDINKRTGSVVSNHQFQFDGPPQAGAIYTGGFSVCANGSLAIGGSTRWWQCRSGTFNNLYDESVAPQCEEIRIQVTFPQQPTPSSTSVAAATSVAVASSAAAATSVAVASSSVPVMASVQSSLVTITGAVSTVSKSAIGPSASFSSNSSAIASGFASASGSAFASASASASASAVLSGTTRAPPAATATGAPEAPQAGGAAPVSFGVARGSMLAAFVVIFGAALVL